ncbi:uncharacterized protein TNCV_4656471 [Trichonephila clavipes]|nr:uncharacterized protein TNCV_4656471 [Trichonephila clavipes]
MECVKREWCPICNGCHHFSICFRNRHDDDLSPKRDTDNTVSAVIKTEVNSVLLQTCAALIDIKNEQEVVRLFLDNGSQRSFVLKSTSEKFNFPILRKENLSICTFGAKETETKTLNIVKIKLKNRDDPNLCIEIEAVETEHISITNLPTPDRNIDKKFRYLKNVQLADSYEFNDKEISILIGADYYYQVVTGRITRLNKNLVTVETLFGWSLQGQSTDSEDLLTMSVIVNESNISKQLSEFWNLENLGIEAEVSDEENIDNDIMSEFEAGISYQNKRYKVKFPWKPNMKTLLENNEEIARKRFLKLRSRFKNDSSLFEDYKLVVNNYLSEKIIQRVPFEEENLEHNIFYLPHRAVIRTDKTTSKLRIVFDALSHAKSQLSLNDCLHTGLNFIPNLFFLLIKFRVNPIAFVADINMAFLMIEIDESERDFTRFFWDENPGIDLENKRLDIFRMTRVLFGVKSSPFLLAATIKHHLKKYVDIFPDTFNHLNQSLYVDDFLCGHVSVQAALTTCIESKQILEDASMDLRKWRTNSSELNKRLKNLKFEVDEHKESLNTLIASKVLGVGWNEKYDTFYFDSSDLGTFLSKRINTKRYLLQATGRLFDPVGFIGPYTIRIKCLIQEIWCLGLDWDDKLPKQLEVSWNKWCNEIHYLSEIEIPRYYFQNFLPSNATTIQSHCFSDASKKAYGTVAYLRIELNDGNIISSFVASKGRVAPLKTLSIPRLELMGSLLSARLSENCNCTHTACESFLLD